MTKQIQDAYIVAATRTAVGKRKGALRNVRPDDMLAHVIRSLIAQVPEFDKTLIGDVVTGCAIPEAEQGYNVSRIGALLGGIPESVPAFTINRFCSSGLNAVAIAADRIRLGETDIAIGAGTETMSMMNQMMGNKISLNPSIFEKEENYGIGYGMGLTAERVATKWNVTREQQDEFAVASHLKAVAAIKAGKFKDEISPYLVRDHVPDMKTGTVRIAERMFDTDEGPRPDSSMQSLGKLRPVFQANGTVTAGTSSQMSDGAGAVLLMSERALKQFNIKPIARFVRFAVAGVPPDVMGIGPIEAVPRALKAGGVKQDDLGWIELNEAFAAQALAVIKTLGFDPAKVNPQGGAIALGHPLGATGAIRTATVMNAMQREKFKYGMVTMCIGTGMGAAGIFEKV